MSGDHITLTPITSPEQNTDNHEAQVHHDWLPSNLERSEHANMVRIQTMIANNEAQIAQITASMGRAVASLHPEAKKMLIAGLPDNYKNEPIYAALAKC